MASSDRKPFETSTVIDQDFLDACHDNALNQLEMICDIFLDDRTLRVSDRNKYVGNVFYEARTNFPVLKRTVGEYLSPSIEFSDLTLSINNIDGAFNDVLPGGSAYDGWAGKRLTVSLGLRDVASTYKVIFDGFITPEGGFDRDTKSITVVARDKKEEANRSFPTASFSTISYPDIEDDKINLAIPEIYGDWTTDFDARIGASVPAFVVNGALGTVNGETEILGVPQFTTNVSLVISNNDLQSLDTANIILRRSDLIVVIDPADIVNVDPNNKSFEILQQNITQIDGNSYTFARGDEFFVRVLGRDLGTFDNNIVAIAEDILIRFGGFVAGDFDSSWATYKSKSTPVGSDIANILARAWIQETQNVVEYALSLLEQVRLEFFVNSELKLEILALHFEDFNASPSFTLRNWDVVQGSFRPNIDDRNNFNRAKADFNFLPSQGENFVSTDFFRNQAAIDQLDGREISKLIVYTNLYKVADVEKQVEETLKLTGATFEFIETEVTWRSLLLDVGDFICQARRYS